MEKIDYFEGRFTLSPNIILRRSFFNYTVYNIITDSAAEINLFFYTVLNLFLHNATNLSEIGDYFSRNNIPHDLNSVQGALNYSTDYRDILIKSEKPFRVSNPYCDFRLDQPHEHTPESIDLLITNKCNLRCPHCYRNSTSKDSLEKIPLDRFFVLLDEMEQLRVRSLKITGGEAFIVKELYDIVEHASRKRMHITILSNATLPLSEKWLNLLSKNNISLGVSLDGTKAESHDKIRGRGAFERTIMNLKKMTENGVRYSLTFTVNIHNFMEINSVVELAIKLGAVKLNFNFIEESGRALDNKGLYINNKLDIPAIKREISDLKEEYKNAPLVIKIADNHGLASDEKDIARIRDKKDLIICKAGFSGLAIDAFLRVFPCIYGIGGKKEYSLGSLMNKSISEVWNDPALNIFRGGITINDLPRCRECDKKDSCNLKYCRLRPLYEGDSLYDVVSFCEKIIEQSKLTV
ncbi:MAG: radical SAM protein [Proteiniphilum sp.]|jgi:MoaA/NifB/PqqE/SkfB family radical SAM enzyme|uniref:radical SAM protein n=1 Tax=Proteiniphilum sp. TaxID=1926877 RepID=UPI002B219E23|nr:radical SAM protein [Proteiniphilum sp.]MEA5062105.1 radical SAM protein [Petrimonas sp.]MEA5128978.1 radical SAM protein [Proteiniphilum sp.]